jgi:hypothetical protein
MKKNIVYSTCLLLAVIFFTSCNKNDITQPDGFTVTTTNTTYKVGDTAVFNFTGNPNQIVFFSGEIGKNYAFANRNIVAGIPKLVFQTNMTQGILPNNDSLRLYVSSNLKGYDSASVVAATWTDITARNTKWPTALSTTFVTSDSIALDDFNTADSINIAFRAIGKKYPTAAQRKWQIQNLTLTNFLSDGNAYALFSTFANTGFVQANIKNNPAPSLSSINYNAWNVGQAGVNANNGTLIINSKVCNSNGIPIQTAYPITFDPSSANNIDENDDWLITSAINLKTVKPDVGTVIKNALAVTLTSFSYKLTKAGTYTATFVASNNGKNDQKQVVRQVQITVVP